MITSPESGPSGLSSSRADRTVTESIATSLRLEMITDIFIVSPLNKLIILFLQV